MQYGTCNGKPMNCFADSTDHFTDKAEILLFSKGYFGMFGGKCLRVVGINSVSKF